MAYLTNTFSNLIHQSAFFSITFGNLIMIAVALLFLYLAIARGFEPLLLVPIAFGMLLVNIYPDIMLDPAKSADGSGGLLHYFYQLDEWGILPPLIFMGVGAMTDFGPLIARPSSLLMGAAAQFGVFVALLGAMLLTIVLTLGAMLYMRPELLRVTTPQNLNNGTVATVPASSDATDWTAVASAVSPAVVTIQSQNASSGGTGSGVIYDAQGDIVTNYHVISPAINGGQIQVTLADGRLYGAGIVGHDKTTDLAVIRLENPPSNLTVARFASSQSLQVGAPVMAIGAPLGLSNTVTTGIVSALNRPVEVSMDEDSTSQDQAQASSDLVVTNAIQIDASINPGNSGGPLFDATGAVIGINSSIKSLATSADGQAGSIGLGFAIPSDLVVSIADQLITTGSASHGMLGVTVKAATVTVGSDTYVGAQVQEVSSGSGAAAAGLRSGDVILKVEGQEVTSPKQLIGYVRRYRAGDTINLTIARDGATRDVSVTIQGS
mgnify:CR=1 FL=1